MCIPQQFHKIFFLPCCWTISEVRCILTPIVLMGQNYGVSKCLWNPFDCMYPQVLFRSVSFMDHPFMPVLSKSSRYLHSANVQNCYSHFDNQVDDGVCFQAYCEEFKKKSNKKQKFQNIFKCEFKKYLTPMCFFSETRHIKDASQSRKGPKIFTIQ